MCLLLMVKLRGKQQKAHLVIHHVAVHQYHPVKVLVGAESIMMGSSLKLNSWCEVCAHFSILKNIQDEKKRGSGNDSLPNEIS